MQFLHGYSGLFPQVFHSKLFALKSSCYSNVEIHPELLSKYYFSHSVTVAAGWACGDAGRGGVLEFDFIQFAK